MIYLYLFGTCFHFIYVFMIIGKDRKQWRMLPKEFASWEPAKCHPFVE